MPRGPITYHVVPVSEGGWAVRRGGASRASNLCPTKLEAVQRGRELSRRARAELRIHNRDGKIASSDSHGGDPFPPRG